jgi:diguanylate cyclase (GGDEF)-like protein/PAS domain S-box-containing protein
MNVVDDEVGAGHRRGLESASPRDTVELQLLEHSPDPLCVHADGRVVYVNPAGVEAIAARSADEVVGRLITDFVHPDHVAPMLARVADLRREGESSSPAEAVLLRLDGSEVNAEVVSVLTRWDGKPANLVIFRDVSLRKAAQATLHLQSALVAHATDAIIATALDGAVTSWNPAAETIYQRPATRALALPISEAVGAAIDPAAVVARGGVEHCTHRAADGSARSVRVTVAAMDDGYVLVCSDETALRRAEQRVETVVNSLEAGVMVLDAHCRPQSINPAARRILDFPSDQTLLDGLDMSTVFPLLTSDGKPLGSGPQLIREVLARGATIRNVVIGIDLLDGSRRWLSASVRPLDDPDTGQPAALASFTDITERYNEQIRLDHKAHHDSLTGLPNRAYAEARATQALQGHPPTLAAVMFIDLDNIKKINDILGHHAGDVVIITAAERIRSALRREDFLARHGGDEFVVLLFGDTGHAALEQLADRIHGALAEPLEALRLPARTLTASVGITKVFPADHRNAAEILHDADAAMYEAKVFRATTRFANTPGPKAIGNAGIWRPSVVKAIPQTG